VASRGRARASRPKVRKDWTYVDATYSERTFNLSAGVITALTLPLTISQNARKLLSAGPLYTLPATGAGNAPTLTSWAGIPEGGRQRCFGLDGGIVLRPNTWNVGNAMQVGMRIIVADQDPFDLSSFLTPGYSMWVDSATTGESVATSANQGHFGEQFFIKDNLAGTAVTSSGSWWIPIKRKFPRGITLRDGTALFLYMESVSGSVTCNVRPRMRALMQSSS